ncbi:sugar phosphate isomerase/epimerase family protein [Deinococcus planocerae]|uniref:sugar phosphate isomerase/epimerase family protein n=1 Tax=Deinococcus planocerae TaxID=1737569 RepID=UPI000C7EB77E|nr:sugar phosphate isomerase/epimerase [Deinococcus planocerae]
MRLGGPVFAPLTDPDAWVEAARRHGYEAVFCPADDGPLEQATGCAKAAVRAGLLLAEVPAWSNPISTDDAKRRASIRRCQERLALADELGAHCCVNIAGSRGEQWDGPHPSHYDEDVFDLIVATVQEIIDAVGPKRTFYTLETMPWTPPDSADSYLRLIRAVDRTGFGVHFDPVNLINSPERYSRNGQLIEDFALRLGPHIKSCHAKDVTLHPRMLAHIDEVRPGLGGLDYPAFLRALDRLDPELPLILEHLPNEEEYALAARHIREVARSLEGEHVAR